MIYKFKHKLSNCILSFNCINKKCAIDKLYNRVLYPNDWLEFA